MLELARKSHVSDVSVRILVTREDPSEDVGVLCVSARMSRLTRNKDPREETSPVKFMLYFTFTVAFDLTPTATIKVAMSPISCNCVIKL